MSLYVDNDLLSKPLNGLATSTEILNEQYDIFSGTDGLVSSTDLDIDAFKSAPAALSPEEKELYELRQTINTETNPSVEARDLVLRPSLVEQNKMQPEYFDGPKWTGRTVKTVAETYGLPTSIQQTIDDAQDAVLGITRDLTKSHETKTSLYEIITKDNRLRGIGALLIIAAVIGFIIKILAGT